MRWSDCVRDQREEEDAAVRHPLATTLLPKSSSVDLILLKNPIYWKSFGRAIHIIGNRDTIEDMAPAGDFQFGQPDTFTLTNACPQHPTLNRMLWNRLEQWVRRVVEDCELLSTTSSANSTYKNEEVLVLTGPRWLPASKGPNDNAWEYRYLALGQPPSLVSVPTHFFKLVVVLGYNDDENTSDDTNTRILQYAAFCGPNHGDKEMENAPWENYLVRWTDLEAVVGMQFFPRLLVGSSSDHWRILADQASEAVWKRDRLLLLLDDNGSSSNKLGK
jgi:hypothetical protein